MSLRKDLDLLLQQITNVPTSKRYWFIRTQGGRLYETFVENNVVALEHFEVPLWKIPNLKNQAKDDSDYLNRLIRDEVKQYYELRSIEDDSFDAENKRRISLIANQIFKFIEEIKIGDTVIIPSYNSDVISFGTITENFKTDFSRYDIKNTDTNAILRRKVKWIKHIIKRDVDPYLYKMFTAQQAVNDVGAYAEVVERSLQDFFILDDEAHVIINVLTESEISARDLFGLGSELMDLIDDFSEFADLGISSRDLQISVSLNSPGKIDLKSKIKSTTFIAGILLFVFGGSIETKSGLSIKTPGISGLMEAYDRYQTHKQERSMRQQIFDKYKDSLQIKQPDDFIKLVKQVSDNKDIAK